MVIIFSRIVNHHFQDDKFNWEFDSSTAQFVNTYFGVKYMIILIKKYLLKKVLIS